MASHTAHLYLSMFPSQLHIKSPTHTQHTNTPTNTGYKWEINLCYGANAGRTTDPWVPVRTTSSRSESAGFHLLICDVDLREQQPGRVKERGRDKRWGERKGRRGDEVKGRGEGRKEYEGREVKRWEEKMKGKWSERRNGETADMRTGEEERWEETAGRQEEKVCICGWTIIHLDCLHVCVCVCVPPWNRDSFITVTDFLFHHTPQFVQSLFSLSISSPGLCERTETRQLLLPPTVIHMLSVSPQAASLTSHHWQAGWRGADVISASSHFLTGAVSTLS